MVTLVGSQTFDLTSANSGTLYNITGITTLYQDIYCMTSTLTSGDAGLVWTFYNGNDVTVGVGSATLLSGQSVGFIWDGTTLISI